MPQKIECLAGDGCLHVFKLARDWQRNLEILVTPVLGGHARKVPFPAAVDRVAIDGLDPEQAYSVRVRRSRLWERFRHPAREFTAQPRTRNLRLLITGSGRSGTQTFAHYFDGLAFADGTPITARHEPLADWVLEALAAGDREFPVLQQRGALHNVESAPYYSLYPDVIRADQVVLVIRDGRRVVQSGLNRGWYDNDSPWNRIKPNYQADQFESACRLWVDANTRAAERADHVFRLEDLVTDSAQLGGLCAAVGVVASGKELPHSNRGGKPSTGFTDWTDQDRQRFSEICGDLMDQYYEGWRENW